MTGTQRPIEADGEVTENACHSKDREELHKMEVRKNTTDSGNNSYFIFACFKGRAHMIEQTTVLLQG